MFFRASRSRAVAKAAIEAVFTPYFYINGQPPRFWVDPFVMGYVSGVAYSFTCRVYGRAPTAGAFPKILAGVITDLSKLNPLPVLLQMDTYANGQDPSYLKGMDAGLKIYKFTYRELANEISDPDVEQAVAMAKAMGNADRSTIAAMLQMLLLNSELNRRFENI